MGHALDIIAPIALAVVGTAVGGPVGGAAGAAIGSGGVNYSQTHNFGSALKSGALAGAGSYAGGTIANGLFGGGAGSIADLGTVGGDLGITGASSDIAAGASGLPGALPESTMSIADEFGSNAFGGAIQNNTLPWSIGAGSSDIASALGRTAGGAVGSALNTPVSQILGSYVGNSLASQYAPEGQPSNKGNYPWIPAAPGQPGGGAASSGLPSSLNSMSSLTPQQQATGLATQGVYGGGLGPQEQGYFKNLVQKQLVPSYGQSAPLSSLMPIENTYLSNLGFGNPSSSSNLAQALSQWNPSA